MLELTSSTKYFNIKEPVTWNFVPFFHSFSNYFQKYIRTNLFLSLRDEKMKDIWFDNKVGYTVLVLRVTSYLFRH